MVVVVVVVVVVAVVGEFRNFGEPSVCSYVLMLGG